MSFEDLLATLPYGAIIEYLRWIHEEIDLCEDALKKNPKSVKLKKELKILEKNLKTAEALVDSKRQPPM